MRTSALFTLLALSSFGCAAQHAAAVDEEASRTSNAALGDPASITFGSDWSVRVSGALVAGGKVDVAYDLARLPTCRGEQGGIPQWSVGGSWRIGGGPVHTFALGGLDGTVGPLSGVAHASITPDAQGDLQLWFSNVNRYGCNAWDSAYGANYHFAVAADPRAPGWIGNANVVVSRATCSGGPCDGDLRALAGGFSFDTWARQRAAITAAYFQVWKSGVTDFDNADLWKQLDVQLHAHFGDGTTFTADSTSYVSFDHRVGNDARYVIPLRPLDPFAGPSGFGGGVVTKKADCPKVPLRKSADGSMVETDLFFYVTVNGVELRPAAGATYKGTFSDYAGNYAVCMP